MELIQHDVLQSGGGDAPDIGVLGAQEQLVEHLVVGEQEVRRVLAHGGAVGDESGLAHGRASRAGGFAGVEAGGDPRERWLCGQQLGEAFGLVGGQGVHRVQQEGLDPADALGAGTPGVVEHGVEKGLGLAGAGAGHHQGRLRAPPRFGRVRRGLTGQAGKGLCLVDVGPEREGGGCPVQHLGCTVVGGAEWQARSHVGPVEHACAGAAHEFGECREGGSVRQGECRGQEL